MLRLLLFLLFFLVIYYLVKSYLSRLFPASKKYSQNKKNPPIVDELVQDPICKTYVPKKEAIVYGKKGRLYYFCSKKCLEEFKKQG